MLFYRTTNIHTDILYHYQSHARANMAIVIVTMAKLLAL